MRVELVHVSLGSTEGGGATYVDEVIVAIAGMIKCRHQFYVLSWRPAPPALSHASNIQWIHVQRPLTERILARLSHSARKFTATCRGQTPPPHPYEQALTLARKRLGIQCALAVQPWHVTVKDLPYVATVWDLEHRLSPMFPEVSADGMYDARERHFQDYLGRAARIIVGTEEGKRQIQSLYGISPERIAVIPMPTPSFALTAPTDVRRPTSLPATLDGNFIFYPAQFWAHKNHVGLLRAIAILKQEMGISVPLVLTGSDKGNRSHIESTATQLGIGEQVYFPGFVSEAELIWLYQHCLALGFVSFFGPDNLPPLEAFALGCPVIAARLKGTEQQLGDAAFLVDPRDEQEIARAIQTVASDSSLRATLIRRGAERAKNNTASHYAERLLTLLDEVERYRRCWA